MLSFKEYFLFEARRNKQHPSQKRENAVDTLAKYKDKDDISITYTMIDKVGVNTKSEYPDTPIGVYAFPIKSVWEDIDKEGVGNVDFEITEAHNFIFVLKESGNIIDVSDYTSSNYKKDLDVLRKMYGKDYVDGIVYFYENRGFPPDYVNTLYDKTWFSIHTDKPEAAVWVKSKLDAFNKYKNKYPFFAINMIITEITTGEGIWSDKVKNKTAEMTKVFRRMGYDGISDKKGLGLIHPAEPYQIVFLSPKAYKVVDKIKIDKRTDFLKKSDREAISRMRGGDSTGLSPKDRERLKKRGRDIRSKGSTLRM